MKNEFSRFTTTKPKRVIGTEDLVQIVVTIESMRFTLPVDNVKFEHGTMDANAPCSKDAMNKGSTKVVDRHCNRTEWFNVLGKGKEAGLVNVKESWNPLPGGESHRITLEMTKEKWSEFYEVDQNQDWT